MAHHQSWRKMMLMHTSKFLQRTMVTLTVYLSEDCGPELFTVAHMIVMTLHLLFQLLGPPPEHPKKETFTDGMTNAAVAFAMLSALQLKRLQVLNITSLQWCCSQQRICNSYVYLARPHFDTRKVQAKRSILDSLCKL